MESINKVVLTLAFADATTRNLTFNGVDDNALVMVKGKIMQLNANMPEVLAVTFLSANGAKCTMINAAKIVVTSEEVIYNAG